MYLRGIRDGFYTMMEIALKLIIIIMFLCMQEIPYIVKLLAILVIGTIGIIDWHTGGGEND